MLRNAACRPDKSVPEILLAKFGMHGQLLYWAAGAHIPISRPKEDDVIHVHGQLHVFAY